MTLAAIAMPMVATVLWVLALIVDPGPLTPANALLVGVSLITMAFVGVIGVLLVGGHWAQRTTVFAMTATLAVAVVRPIDAWWVIGLVASASSLAALFLPVTTDRLRKLPPAAGPPWRALLLPLLMLGSPLVLGLASWDETHWATLLVGLLAPVATLLYTRVIPGGLLAVRLVWPALAAVTAPFPELLPGVVALALALAVVTLAWHPSVKVAFHPPREEGSAYAIPPELTPRAILDAANLDDRGRAR